MPKSSDPHLGQCPVAALAEEAAVLARIWRLIRDATASANDRTEPTYTLADLFKDLGWTAHGADQMLPNDFTREVLSRLRAIARLAPHRQAVSLKGVAFQALLTSHRAADMLCEPFGGATQDTALRIMANVDRCVVSILAQLASEGAALSDDLLEFYGMGRGDQPSRVVQLILALPDAA